VRGSRYRVRPRLFLFIGVVLAILVVLLWPRGRHPAAPPSAHRSSPPPVAQSHFKVPKLGWYAGTTQPQPAEGLSAVTAAGDLIAVGGSNGTSSSTSITAFGPAPLAISLPTGVHDASAVVTQSTLYVLGGGSAVPISTVQAVSLTGQNVPAPPALPTPISDAASLTTPHGFVLVGGYTGSSYLDTVSTWTPGHLTVLAHLPIGVRYAAAAWYNGSLIVAGGLTAQGVAANVYAVNLKNGHVSAWPSLPHPVYHAEMAVFGGDLMLVGGEVNGNATDATWVYDPVQKTWVAGPNLPTPTADGALQVYNGQLWYLGGFGAGGPTPNVWIGKSS
jgi:hypothetical protein